MQIANLGSNSGVSAPTKMPPLSDAGSILAQSVQIDDGAYADGYEVDFSSGAFE